MTAVHVICFTLTGMILIELIAGLFILSKRLEYSHFRIVEEHRNFFADLRKQLFDLVRDEKISPNSQTFKMTFYLLTNLIRRPDFYNEFSNQLLSLLQKGNGSSKATQENYFSVENIRKLSSEEQNIFMQMVQRICIMPFDFAPFRVKFLISILPFLRLERFIQKQMKKIELDEWVLSNFPDGCKS